MATITVFNPKTHDIRTIDLDTPTRSRVFLDASTFAKKFKLDIGAVENEVAELAHVPEAARETYFVKNLKIDPAAEFLHFISYGSISNEDGTYTPLPTEDAYLINKEAAEGLLVHFAVHMNKRAKQQLEWLMVDFAAVEEVTAEWDKEAA